MARLTTAVTHTRPPGYCRVLSEGWFELGAPMVLVDRPCPGITVAMVNDFGHGSHHDIKAAQVLAACPLLP